ncbi:MAG: response regulator [Oculatellaceae cyanobacterium bins.114]|nr:response regulator [Oculatellaceae cyanobacterium bins.114]
MRILLIEDDEKLAYLLQKTLARQQYQVDLALDGQQGWNLIEALPYDLIVMDIVLPKLDGISFCKQLRSSCFVDQSLNQETPILLMTALDTATNRVIGLDAGADDYIVKPLDLEELQARVRALGRRRQVQRSPQLKWGALCLYPKNCDVTCHGKSIVLTLKEYQLLELFLRHPNQIFSQSSLIEHLWGLHETPTENAVRAQIKGLRQKLKQAGAGDLIETLYKLGYRLRRPHDQADSQDLVVQVPAVEQYAATDQISVSPQPTVPLELWEVWKECQTAYCDRLEIIESAITALQGGSLTATLQQQATQEAHTLIGSLGSFGLDRASQLARHIQQTLKQNELTPSNIKYLTQLSRALRQEMGCVSHTDEANVDEADVEVSSSASAISVSIAVPVATGSTLLIIDDTDFANQLMTEAIAWNVRAIVAPMHSQARKVILKEQPHAVILRFKATNAEESTLAFLAELQNWCPEIPVLVLTSPIDLTSRVQLSRLGCNGVLQQPISPRQVLLAVVQALQPQPTHFKSLIVSKHPPLSGMLRQLLEPAGYQLTVTDNLQQFWQMLEQTHPNLLILETEYSSPALSPIHSMLEVTSFDLCQTVRRDLRWRQLPIIFLSTQHEPHLIERGLKVGADDVLCQAIAPTELLARVQNRLERSQIQQYAVLDASISEHSLIESP